eukprot:CAMPEP_0180786846 /NCGR_PEP_ID=MMETSP1038_2-20121128/51043_1 /TAXON_ID=632150 /ORGANISM="Azadinium spinosum, Strain 3D9" /LENGTH=68 /DNA_ID=CAMNT_0022824045 /DNA_START=84 /DNA_END=286 /DNA_ORIENTATION=-
MKKRLLVGREARSRILANCAANSPNVCTSASAWRRLFEPLLAPPDGSELDCRNGGAYLGAACGDIGVG